MSAQINLFDAPLPPISRRNDPATSKEAAAKITDSGKRNSQCKAILLLCRDYPGRTSRELADLTFDLDRYTVARRLPELEKMGLVRKSGVKVCSISKMRACTWEATK